MAQPLRKTLRIVRELVELTQAEMARRIGMPEHAYGRFERGSPSTVPSAATLRRMQRVLSGSLDDLLGPECVEASGRAARPSSGGRRSRQPASQRSGSHARTGQRRLALRVDLG